MLTHRQYLLTNDSTDNNPPLSSLYYDFNFLSFQLTYSQQPRVLMRMKQRQGQNGRAHGLAVEKRKGKHSAIKDTRKKSINLIIHELVFNLLHGKLYEGSWHPSSLTPGDETNFFPQSSLILYRRKTTTLQEHPEAVYGWLLGWLSPVSGCPRPLRQFQRMGDQVLWMVTFAAFPNQVP